MVPVGLFQLPEINFSIPRFPVTSLWWGPRKLSRLQPGFSGLLSRTGRWTIRIPNWNTLWTCHVGHCHIMQKQLFSTQSLFARKAGCNCPWNPKMCYIHYFVFTNGHLQQYTFSDHHYLSRIIIKTEKSLIQLHPSIICDLWWGYTLGYASFFGDMLSQRTRMFHIYCMLTAQGHGCIRVH